MQDIVDDKLVVRSPLGINVFGDRHGLDLDDRSRIAIVKIHSTCRTGGKELEIVYGNLDAIAGITKGYGHDIDGFDGNAHYC